MVRPPKQPRALDFLNLSAMASSGRRTKAWRSRRHWTGYCGKMASGTAARLIRSCLSQLPKLMPVLYGHRGALQFLQMWNERRSTTPFSMKAALAIIQVFLGNAAARSPLQDFIYYTAQAHFLPMKSGGACISQRSQAAMSMKCRWNSGDSACGRHTRFHSPSEARARLIAAIARGRRWLDQIMEGAIPDLAAIATREDLSEKTVRSVLSLSFLAPDIVQAAIDGRLPRGFGISQLTDLPIAWEAQRQQLGLA
jgi:hypothetical protein